MNTRYSFLSNEIVYIFFADGGSKQVSITDALIYMITVDNLPLWTTEKRGFKKFIQSVAPLYKPPSRKTITTLIDHKYSTLSSKVQAELASIQHLSLTTDAWTETKTTQSYLGVTVHYLKELSMKAVNIGAFPLNERHTGEYISDQLSLICEKWNIKEGSIVAVVTDNGANMVKSVSLAFGKKKHLSCFSHTLQLIPTKAMELTQGLCELITSVKEIITYFKHCVNASDQLKRLQLAQGKTEGTILKLIQDVSTRWNSEFYMIERFVVMAPLVSTALFNVGNVKAPNMLSRERIDALKDLLPLLQPLEEATREMSAEQYVTSSKVIPIINCIKQSIDRTTPQTAMAQELKMHLQAQFEQRFRAIESHTLLAISTLLDPRFKKTHFTSPMAVATAIRNITTETGYINPSPHVSPEPKRSSAPPCSGLWKIHQTLVASSVQSDDETGGIPLELKQFLNQPVIDIGNDPITYWDSVKSVYPKIYKVATKYLSVVATSVSSERLFSKAGEIANFRRSRLLPKRLQELVFLSSLSEKQWEC